MHFYFLKKFLLPYEYYFSLVILALNIKNPNAFPNIPDEEQCTEHLWITDASRNDSV